LTIAASHFRFARRQAAEVSEKQELKRRGDVQNLKDDDMSAVSDKAKV